MALSGAHVCIDWSVMVRMGNNGRQTREEGREGGGEETELRGM